MVAPVILVVALVVALVAIGAITWALARRARAASDERWRLSMQKLGAFCDVFAAQHGLVCVKGGDQWPYGWPRLRGTVGETEYSLAFGWRHGEDWVASMRMRAPSREHGEIRAWRVPPPALPTRGRLQRVGDPAFDLFCTVWTAGAIDVAAIVSPAARRDLLAIPLFELTYRDGVAVISWSCESFLADGGDGFFATIEAAYRALDEIANTSRSQRVYR
ncbi:MAG: hypothetical protein WCJ30_09890 [Deltaproteobacteria bacterium]